MADILRMGKKTLYSAYSGMTLSCFFINSTLLTMHIPCGYYSNLLPVMTDSKSYVQLPSIICFSEGVKTWLQMAMYVVLQR